MFSSARKAGILAEAAANLRKREPVANGSRFGRDPSREPELVFKAKDDARVPAGARAPSESSAAVAGSEQQSWWQWVDARIAACLAAHGEEVGEAVGDFCGQQVAALKRELELLRRELATVRDEVAVKNGLRDLQNEVAAARSEAPKVPALAARLEARQERLAREVETTKEKLSRVRTNQCITDYRLRKLSESAATRAQALELKIERTSFQMRELDPSAAETLRTFATETLKSTRQDETLWVLPGPTAGTA
jgi:hypothetical protein